MLNKICCGIMNRTGFGLKVALFFTHRPAIRLVGFDIFQGFNSEHKPDDLQDLSVTGTIETVPIRRIVMLTIFCGQTVALLEQI